MSPPPSALRPLALGEIIDRAATFWRQHFKSLFLLSFGFDVGTYILTKVFQLPLQRANAAVMAAAKQGDFATLGVQYAEVFLMVGAILLGSLWFYYQNMLVVAAFALPHQLGNPTTTTEALLRTWRRLGTLTGAYVLSLLWAVGITLLLMLPGGALAIGGGVMIAASGGVRVLGIILATVGVILAVLGMLGALLWYLLRFCLLGPVLALEDLSVSRVFRRSGELLSGRVAPGFSGRVMVRAMIFVTVVSIILIVVSFLCSMPALVLQLTRGNPLDPATATAPMVSQWLLVPAELLQVAGQAVFGPLGFVAYAFFYLDMRVRREGLDLEQHLEGAAPSGPQPQA